MRSFFYKNMCTASIKYSNQLFQIKQVMPKNVEVSLEEKHDILKGEGLCPDTKDKRNKTFEHFTSFIKNSLKVAGPFSIKKALEDNIVTRAKVYQFYNE